MSKELTEILIEALERRNQIEYAKLQLERQKFEMSIHRSRANPDEDNELRGHINAGNDKDKQNKLFEFENKVLDLLNK